MAIPVALGSTDFTLFVQTVNSSGTPTNADSHAITYAIYSPAGTNLLSGSFTASIVDSKTGWYKTASLSITSGNGFAASTPYRVRIAYAVSGTNRVADQTIMVQ